MCIESPRDPVQTVSDPVKSGVRPDLHLEPVLGDADVGLCITLWGPVVSR